MDEEEEVQKTQEAKKVPGMREVQEIEAGGTEGRKEVELPNFSKRQLSTFEAVFLTEEQVKKCEEMFNTQVESSSPIYLAWKALKVAWPLRRERQGLGGRCQMGALTLLPKSGRPSWTVLRLMSQRKRRPNLLPRRINQ